jgi:hypothetical protein
VTYAILAYALAGALWIVWLLLLRSREGRIRRWHVEGDR